MTRKKVELAYIAGNKARRSSYKKQKKGLLKKANELTTLCGVEACVIIHSAYEPNPVVWPDEERARRMVEQLQRMSETSQKGKVYDHATYLQKQINKEGKNLTRLRQKNRQKEVSVALLGSLAGEMSLEGMNEAHLGELIRMSDKNLEEIYRQLQRFGEEQEPQPLQVLPPPEIPGGKVGPMGQLLLGTEPSDAGSDKSPGSVPLVAESAVE